MRNLINRTAMAILVSTLAVACFDSNVGPEESIVGSWQSVQGAETVTWTFRGDGRLTIATQPDDGQLAVFSTRYSINDETVTLQAYSGADDQGNAVNFAASTCTADVSDRSLRLNCDNGIATFTRLGPGTE